MARNPDRISLSWLLRHPLVATCILLALTMLLPYTRLAERIKLMAFLPAAYAADGVPEADASGLSTEERLQHQLQFETGRLAQALEANAVLARLLADAKVLADPDPAFADVTLPKAVPARVIYHGDSSGWRHGMWLNRGSDDGIEQGMPVVSGRTLVGRAYLVGSRSTFVQLITDPQFAASCVIVDAGNPSLRVRGILRGDASALPHFPRLELDDVPMGDVVRPDMRVLTSDYTGAFPHGLSVGIVREVIPQSGSLQVRIEAALDLADLDVVQVLLHKRPELEQQVLELQRRKVR